MVAHSNEVELHVAFDYFLELSEAELTRVDEIQRYLEIFIYLEEL